MIIGIGCMLFTTFIGKNSVMAKIMFVISLFVLVDCIVMLIAFRHDAKKIRLKPINKIIKDFYKI